MKVSTLKDRMNYYRGLPDYRLPSKSYVIGFLDGRSFSSYTKRLKVPFDEGFIEDMNETAKYLCENISGCKLAFVQSDEISLFLADYENEKTEGWFDYRLCKMLSIAGSIGTGKFNQLRLLRALKEDTGDVSKGELIKTIETTKLAEFDAKFWNVPSYNDVTAWFLYRQNDCTRNSILAAGQAHFSHKQLMNQKANNIQDMLLQEKNINWNDYPAGQKRGRIVVKKNVEFETKDGEMINRNQWVIEDAPMMNTYEGLDYIKTIIPKID